jgi:regulation of enolase protein 1 (concanavalin A-like superfamily)
LAIFVCAFLLATPFLALVPSVRSDPGPGTNADMTRTLTWDFDNPANYSTTNALVSGGFGTLSPVNETVLENTQTGYAQGVRLDNVDINTVPNSIVLDQRVQPVTTVTIQPGPADGMDTCLLEFWPDDYSNGDARSIGIDSLNTKNIRPLLKFDLSSIPSDAVVENATLLVDLQTGNKANAIVFNVHALTANWTQTEASWNSASSTQLWTTPGGDYDPFIFYRGTITKTPGWYPIDVSRLVDIWLKGILANNGMIMVPDNGDNTVSWKYFYASEENTAAVRPKLVVNYTLESPTGVYESKALGPGTNSQFTLASWSNATHFGLTDEFGGTSLSTKWSWLNKPTGSGDYDVGVARPGWLHIRGEGNRELVGSTIGANYIYQRVSGSFNSETHVNVTFSAIPQGAGILLENDPMTWVSFAMTGTGINTRLILQATEQGVSVFTDQITWSGKTDAYLRLDRSGGSISAYYSDDGLTWVLVRTFVPALPYMDNLRLGLCVFSGTSSQRPDAYFDYFRATPIGIPIDMQVEARLGNSTTLTDPSWEAWAPLPSESGSVLGRSARYIQYRVTLTSTQSWVSPQFSGFECHYERYSPDGVITTQDLAISHFKRWLTITTTEQLISGTISYSYSIDHGTTWNPLQVGSNSITDAVPYIMVKAVIHSTDTFLSPKVDRLVAQYAVAATSFYMVTPATVVVGERFSFTLESKDETNATIEHWTGNVGLNARDATGAGPATSELTVTSAWISLSGRVVVANEAYAVKETIRVMASADGVFGLSEPIMFLPSALGAINITPAATSVLEFSHQKYTAIGYDSFWNPIAGMDFDWTADPAIGTLNTTIGSSIDLATGAGRQEGLLTATNGTVSGSLLISVVPPMFPPEFTGSIPDQVQDEDFGTWTLNISTLVSDVEDSWSEMRWYTTNERLVKVGGENQTGNMEIEFTTKKDQWGADVLGLVVVDSDGLTASTTVNVTINPINDAPTIDHITPLVVKHDVDYAYNFRYYIADVDTPLEDLVLSVDGASASYATIRWLTITFNYPLALNGTTQYVVVTVSDGGRSASTVVKITVTDDNVPVSQRLPDLTMDQGEESIGYFNLDNYFTDPDMDVLYFAYGCDHVRVVIQLNHTVDFYAPPDWWGQEYIIFIATDPHGARSEQAMSVTVLHVNQPPTITGVPDLKVRFDSRYDFSLAPYISDPDNPIDTLSIGTDDTHIAVIGATISLLYPQSMNGTRVQVRISVSDGELADSMTINVTISEDSPPYVRPAPNNPPDHSFLEDVETSYPIGRSLSDFFADAEGTGALTFYAFSSSPNVTATAVEIAPGSWSIDFVADPYYNGVSVFTIRATDPEGSIVEYTVNLEVVPVPNAPVLNIQPKHITVVEGTQVAIDLSGNVTDPDVEDKQFDFQAISEYVPDYIVMRSGVLVLEFKDFLSSEESRTFEITVRVVDSSGLSDSDTLTITVVRAPPVNAAKDNPWLYIGMIAMGGAAIGMLLVVVSRRKKPFEVQDMMLIHNDGFLITRLAHHAEGEIDQDVMSGMLTAVLNFVEDSMGTSADSLKTFGFKEYQVLVSRGQKVFAAVVFKGDLPGDIDKPMKEFIDTVERIYKKNLAHWTGDIETDFAGVEVLINRFVKENSKGHKAGAGEGIWRKMASRGKVKPKKVTVNTITQEKVDRRDTLAGKESGK